MNTGSSEDEDEEDPVVFEVDVCLAKDLLERLYLFQYPVRPSNMTYDHTTHLQARIKPKQQKVELELGMDVRANTYSQCRGQQIAQSVDGDLSQDGTTFQGDMMDRHVLSSMRAADDNSKYIAGIYSNGVLQLTPVTGVVQLRPTFNYFDRADEVQKKNAAAAAVAMRDDGGDTSQSEEEVDEAKPVQLRFAKTPRGAAAKKNADRQQQEPEEMWLDMRYHQPHSELAMSERNRLYCRHDNYEAPELTATTRDYMKSLQPQVVKDSSGPAAMPHGVLSLTSLKKMDLKDQIKALLINAKVVQLRQLCALLGSGLDERAIVNGLRQYARLVQGCWVVRSELLYAAGTTLPGSGLPAEKFWPSRDYILFSFNRKRLLSRKEIISATKLPPEDLREMLEQIARQRPAKGWEFMLATDVDFLQRYQEIAGEEFELWSCRYKELVDQLQLSEDNWKDGELSGLSAQAQHQKPMTTQRRIRNANSLSEEPKSPKKIASRHQRSSSQSSRGGDETEPHAQLPSAELPIRNVKLEELSPTKPTTNKLHPAATNISNGNAVVQGRVTAETMADHGVVAAAALKGIIKSEPGNDADRQVDARRKLSKKKEIRFDDSDDSNDSDVERMNDRANESKAKNEKRRTKAAMNDEKRRRASKNGKKSKRSALSSSSDSDEKKKNGSNDINSVMSAPVAMEVEVGGDAHSNDSMNDDTSDEEDEEQIFVPPPAAASLNSNDEERPPSQIFMNELQKFVRESLRSGCMSLSEFKEVLELRQKEPRNILRTGVPDQLLVDTILATGAMEVNLNWPTTKLPLDRRRVFVYRLLGETNDQYRSIVIGLFDGAFGLRRKDIIEAFKAELGTELTSHQYSKMITEFCENHSGHWYLNGTYKSLQMASNS